MLPVPEPVPEPLLVPAPVLVPLPVLPVLVPPPVAGVVPDAAPAPLAGLLAPVVVVAGLELLPPLQAANAAASSSTERRPESVKQFMSIPLPTRCCSRFPRATSIIVRSQQIQCRMVLFVRSFWRKSVRSRPIGPHAESTVHAPLSNRKRFPAPLGMQS
jgi:hypothetical protein